MEKVYINASTPYEVLIGEGLLDHVDEYVKNVTQAKTIVIISDDFVYPFYGEKVEKCLASAGFHTYSYIVEHGENSKSLVTYSEVAQFMCSNHISRRDAVIALGGGVVGDLSGFVASTFQRGMDFISIPTTLLAAVDSSVGGKTAVNLGNGKNQIGTFHQPKVVICDTLTFNTLPENEYSNACAEIIKYGMIGSTELLQKIKEKPIKEQYEQIVYECVSMKRDIVERDEFDNGERMLLNFGHTIGHAIETISGYSIPHGMGVAIGMALITRASIYYGYCREDTLETLLDLITMYDLPSETEYTPELLAEIARSDKKSDGDEMNIIIPDKTGHCIIPTIKKEDFVEWIRRGKTR